MEITNIFAQRIKELREERGLTQGKLADELGISRGALSYYESYQRTADISMLVKFASYFGVTTDYLLGLSENKTNETAGIGQVTGLSDEVITRIKKYKDNFFYRQGLNILAYDKKLLVSITKYIYGFAADTLSRSDFSKIPLRVGNLSSFSKIVFAEMIEYLPRLRERAELQYKDNPDNMERLYMEFLAVYADMEQIKAVESLEAFELGLYDESEYYIPEPFDPEEWELEAKEMERTNIEIENQMERDEIAKAKFLDHMKSIEYRKKGGPDNADDPETR